MLSTPTIGLLSPARLLLPRAIRGPGVAPQTTLHASWFDGLNPTASAIMASRRRTPTALARA
jgi:hypothetical protein